MIQERRRLLESVGSSGVLGGIVVRIRMDTLGLKSDWSESCTSGLGGWFRLSARLASPHQL